MGKKQESTWTVLINNPEQWKIEHLWIPEEPPQISEIQKKLYYDRTNLATNIKQQTWALANKTWVKLADKGM